ncbi:MAG: hypothetical protein QM764_22560 [Chitinophagaceae bacterium]
MKLLRFAILSFIILFLVVYSISLFIPSHVTISRAINMKASSAEAILNKLEDINKWKEWYPGFDTMHIEPIVVANGRLLKAKFLTTTVSVIGTKSGETRAEFTSGNKNPIVSGWKMNFYNNSDSLTLQWHLDFKLKWYPWEKFFSLAYDKMYGSQMELGLQNLKKNVER